jgi:cell wall-associated NlpC family hydrolase
MSDIAQGTSVNPASAAAGTIPSPTTISNTSDSNAMTTQQLPVAVLTDPAFAFAHASFTTAQAIKHYSSYMSAYLSHDRKIVNLFHAQETGSQADQLVERAIWYMENGYTVYGHVYKGYKDYGILDCSSFVSLLYGDFGYNITSASRSYTTVGREVVGVHNEVIGTDKTTGQNLYRVVGLDKLQPGDIFTFWARDNNGEQYISPVAIYMGNFNGKPAVLRTTAERPTALGIVDDFRYWYGSNLFDVRRVLPDNAMTNFNYTEKSPTIPKAYVLPPQKPLSAP